MYSAILCSVDVNKAPASLILNKQLRHLPPPLRKVYHFSVFMRYLDTSSFAR